MLKDQDASPWGRALIWAANLFRMVLGALKDTYGRFPKLGSHFRTLKY